MPGGEINGHPNGLDSFCPFDHFLLRLYPQGLFRHSLKGFWRNPTRQDHLLMMEGKAEEEEGTVGGKEDDGREEREEKRREEKGRRRMRELITIRWQQFAKINRKEEGKGKRWAGRDDHHSSFFSLLLLPPSLFLLFLLLLLLTSSYSSSSSFLFLPPPPPSPSTSSVSSIASLVFPTECPFHGQIANRLDRAN